MNALKLKRAAFPRVKANLPYQPLVCIDMAERPESLDDVAERVHRRSEINAWMFLAAVAVLLLCASVVLRALEHSA